MAYDELAHKKRQRDERIAAGLCARCGKRPVDRPRKTCEHCAGVAAAYTAKYRNRHPGYVAAANKRLGQYRKQWRKDRVADGVCVDCGAPQRVTGFVRCAECLARRRAAGARFRASDPARTRWYTRKHKYGITREEWEAMFAAQGGRCAICRTADNRGRGWHTDHNHGTGEVRGILCEPCNKGLGLFRDDPVSLQRAARYVVIRGGNTTQRQAPLVNTESA